MKKRPPWEIRNKQRDFEDGKVNNLTKQEIFEISQDKIKILNKKLETKNRQIKLIVKTGKDLIPVVSLDKITADCHTFLEQAFNIKHSMILFKKADSRELSVCSYYGYPKENSGYKAEFGKGIIGVTAETGKEIVLNAASRDIKYMTVAKSGGILSPREKAKYDRYDSPGIKEAGSRAAIPLLPVRGEPGALYLESGEPDFFQAEDIEAINIIAVQLAAVIGNARLFREIEGKSRELEEAGDYSESIIKSIPDVLIVIGPDAKIRTVNKAASELLGYKENELIGSNPALIFTEEGDLWFKKLLKEEVVRNRDMICSSKTGAKIPVSFSGSAIINKKSGLTGMVCVAKDTRELKRLLRQQAIAEAARKKAEELTILNEQLASAGEESRESNERLRQVQKELSRKIEIVENFNSIAVGRELKHVELKAEINYLLRKLGKKEYYSIGRITDKTKERVNKMLEESKG